MINDYICISRLGNGIFTSSKATLTVLNNSKVIQVILKHNQV